MGCYNTKSKVPKGITQQDFHEIQEEKFSKFHKDEELDDFEKITRISTAQSLSSHQIKSKRSVYKLKKLRELKTLENGHSTGITQLLKIDDTKMLSVGLDKQIIFWNMITMTKIFSMDLHERIWDSCVLQDRLLIAILGENRDKLYSWKLEKQYFQQQSPITELVDSLKLTRSVVSLTNLEFTNNRFFCVGYQNGEMSVFDSFNMDIAEEIQFLSEPLDILIECKLNLKLKSCLMGSSHNSNIVRLVSFRQSTESFVDIGIIRARSKVQDICELADLQIAIAQQNGEVEIWNLLKTDVPTKTLRSFDFVIDKLISIEFGTFIMGITKDSMIMVWKTQNAQLIYQGDYPVHTKEVTGFIALGDKIFTSSLDSSIRATSLIFKY